MALTLRDSHSYETQIIDAVRSVNRALGGTYGTSSAIYKNEFNQYEVQLIDAIKGIGRTLSGNGLSLAGGDLSGYVTQKDFQSLSARVSKLESESFFRLVDGNVTLKEAYQNLWVPGWLSAGGISDSGGGGGSSYLKDLLDIKHNSSGIQRANGDPVSNGDVLVYDSTTDPLNPKWVAASGGGGSITVTNYGDISTGRIATVNGVDIYNGVKWGTGGTNPNTFTLSINGTTKTVCLDGYSASITGYIGTTQVQTTQQAQNLTGILSVNATSSASSASRIVWDSTNDAWHFYGNLYADGFISAGGISSGSGGGGGGGIDLAALWNSLTNAVVDAYANTKINLAHIPDITADKVSDLGSWISSNVYTLRTQVSTTAANGTLLGVDALSNGASSTAGSDTSRIEWDATNSAWHVYGNLYADGWVSAGGISTGGGGSGTDPEAVHFTVQSLTSAQQEQARGNIGLPTTLSTGYLKYTGSGWTFEAGAGGDVYIGNSDTPTTIKDVVASTYEQGQVLYYIAGLGKWTNVSLTLDDIGLPSSIASASGYLYHDPVSGWAVMPGGGGGGSSVSWGTAYSNNTINLIVNGTTRRVCLNGYSSGGGSYTLPIASSSTLGGIKVGSGLSINSSGVLSVTGGGGGGGSTVEVTQLVTTGTRIAVITVDGNPVDLWAPPSGGGSGSTVNWGTQSSYYAPLTVDNVTKNVLIGTGYVTLDTTQDISGAKTFTNSSGIGIGASSHTLKYNTSLSRFEFNGNLYVTGNIVATGEIAAGA